MTQFRCADDFATIRARLVELRNRRAQDETKMLGQRQNLHSVPIVVVQPWCKGQEFRDGVWRVGNVSSPRPDCYRIEAG